MPYPHVKKAVGRMSLDDGHSVRSFSAAGNSDDIYPFGYKACVAGFHDDLNVVAQVINQARSK